MQYSYSIILDERVAVQAQCFSLVFVFNKAVDPKELSMEVLSVAWFAKAKCLRQQASGAARFPVIEMNAGMKATRKSTMKT